MDAEALGAAGGSEWAAWAGIQGALQLGTILHPNVHAGEHVSCVLCRELCRGRGLYLKPAPAVQGDQKEYPYFASPRLSSPGTYGISAVPSVRNDLGLGVSTHRILIPLKVKTG